MNYPYLGRNTVTRTLPEIHRRKVSLVARGIRRSRQTQGGFLQAFYNGRLDSMATKNQTWKERRAGFIARHMAGRGSLWLKNGNPSRKHLALIAWAYSPDPKGLRRWLATQPNNRSLSPFVRL